MPVLNAEVADIFRQMADLLEIEGANEFRVRAYRNAARTLEQLPRSVNEMVAAHADLTELPGIGDELAAKIEEIVRTGGLHQLEEIESRTPAELAELLDIAGLGPKRVQQLYEELGIGTLDELRYHAEAGDLKELHGFGERTQAKVLAELEREDENEGRTTIDRAEQVAAPLVAYLASLDQDGDGHHLEHLQVAGSYRRRRETVGDLDILAISSEGKAVIDAFTNYEDVEAIVSQGETKSTVRLRSGMQVDLRVVPRESYGAALFYFTGSKAHNVAIRNIAADMGLKVNEYGVFDSEERIAGRTEEGIYDLFGLPFIPPELREDRGEIEAGREGELPRLVALDDIRGDLQMHTTASDGDATLEAMVEGARDLGYAYIAITDHSPHIGITEGLDEAALQARIEEIERLNESHDEFLVLKGIEVDILKDGSLDLSDSVLKQLDIVVGAVHSAFDLSRDAQTERIIRAMDNPYLNIVAHPTGRRIGKRPPYDVDVERLMEAALQRGCYLEINANPERLDLNDVQARMAKEMGLKLAISTDAHRVGGLRHMRYGVDQARRGWLEADDVLNTLTWEELSARLKR